MAVSAVAARVIHCHRHPDDNNNSFSSYSSSGPDQVKLVPRTKPCTLRSYPRGGLMKRVMKRMMMRQRKKRSFDHHHREDDDPHHHHRGSGVLDNYEDELELDLEPFLENVFENIEGSKNKIYYFEIITGRLAMITIAVTMGMELATGESIFNKVDAQAIAEGLIGCLAATTCAAFFAHSPTARKKVGRIFIIGFNIFVEALIDNLLDGLFLESDMDDPFDNSLN